MTQFQKPYYMLIKIYMCNTILVKILIYKEENTTKFLKNHLQKQFIKLI